MCHCTIINIVKNNLNQFKCLSIEDMLKFPLDTEYSGAVKKKLDGKVPVAEFKKAL